MFAWYGQCVDTGQSTVGLYFGSGPTQSRRRPQRRKELCRPIMWNISSCCHIMPSPTYSGGITSEAVVPQLRAPFLCLSVRLSVRHMPVCHDIIYYHYLPTVVLIIGIPSPSHSFTPGLNPYFSANPPYRSLSFFFFRINYMDFQDCLLLLLSISVSLLFSFFLFLHFFSCRFRAVD